MNLKKDLNTLMLTFSVLAIVLGIICIVFAEALSTAIPYIIGALIIIDGVYTLVKYFRRKDLDLPNNFGLAQGLINLVLGILIICSTEFFATAFGIIIAIALLVFALFQLNVCVNLKKMSETFIIELVEAVILIIFAILLLVFSNSAIKIIITIIGVGLLVVGLYIGVKSYILNRQINKMVKKEEEVIIETTATEVKEDIKEEEK